MLFLGASDGLYKTPDGGQTWRHVYAWPPAFQAVVGIAVDPANPKFMYLSTNEAPRFLASSDSGETWQPLDIPRSIFTGGAGQVWVDPSGSGTVAIGFGLSRNHGMTWSPMTELPGAGSLAFTVPDPRHPGWIYAASSAGSSGSLFLSQDWGATWTQRPGPRFPSGSVNETGIAELLFDPDIPGTLYARDLNNYLHVSDDVGATWHTRGSVNGRLAILSRQCSGGALLSASKGYSFDFGLTWQPSLTRDVDLAAGPGCAVYAVRSVASDAFIAKLAPGGGEVVWSTFLGGSWDDSPAALDLDSQGNLYVAGIASSPDFPITLPRAGVQGRRNVFAAKFDPDGHLVYSTVLGGEGDDEATALSVNSNGEVHVVGSISSKSFPATDGAFQTQLKFGSDGFAFKLTPDGNLVYASYLPDIVPAPAAPDAGDSRPSVIAVAAERSGSALVGGSGGRLARMSADGSALSALPNQPGRIFTLETDSHGDIYVGGQSLGGTGECFQGYVIPYLYAGVIYVNKLKQDSLEQLYPARIAGDCQTWPASIRVNANGEATVAAWAFNGYPLVDPVLPFAGCSLQGSGALTQLSADGSVRLFSSYVDKCVRPPVIALAPDGAIYAGGEQIAASFQTSGVASILRIPVPPPGGITVEKTVNSLDGMPDYASPGALLTITGQNFVSEQIDLGLNDPNPLPTELGGLHVTFDGLPAQLMQVAPDHLICVAPDFGKGKSSLTVRIANDFGARSFVLLAPGYTPYVSSRVAFLTHYFPDLPPSGSVDGNIRNADGTVNDEQHPTAPGSTITLYATGVTGAQSIPLAWNAPPRKRYEIVQSLSGTVRPMPGFIDALSAVDFRIPDAPAPGVYAVPVPGVLTRFDIGRVGSGIGVWVK